jgi:diguanylate cyclase (GGDEF)-like protein
MSTIEPISHLANATAATRAASETSALRVQRTAMELRDGIQRLSLMAAIGVAAVAVTTIGAGGLTSWPALVRSAALLAGLLVVLLSARRTDPEPLSLILVGGLTLACEGEIAFGGPIGTSALLALPLLPVAVAVMVPWRAAAHRAWLAGLAASGSLVILAGSPAMPMNTLQAIAILMGGAILGAIAQSAVGRERLRAAVLETRVDALDASVRAMARLDPLTGAWNRAALGADLGALIARQAGAVSVVLMAVDRYDTFADQHGHLEAEARLSHLAAIIGTELHGLDRVYRLGGPQLAVVFDGTALADAIEIGERLRRSLEPSIGPEMTVSVGVAGAQPGVRLRADELLRIADEALARARSGGLGRISAMRVVRPT